MAGQILDPAGGGALNAKSPRAIAATGITAITKAAAAVITVANGFVTGDVVRISGCAGMTQINGKTGTVTAASSTAITVDIATNGATITPVAVATTDNLDPCVINSTSHGLAVGDTVVFYGMSEHTELNGMQAIVVGVATDNQYTIDYDATGDTDEATGGFGVEVSDLYGTYTGSAGRCDLILPSPSHSVFVAYEDTLLKQRILASVDSARLQLEVNL